MFELIQKGGPVMWLLVVCCLIGVIVFLERLLQLHRSQIKADDFLKGIFNILQKKNVVEAVSICEETPGPVPQLIKAAVLHHDEDLDDVRRAVEEAGLVEIPRLERSIGLLATLAQITPLLGLLGTVLGMMQILMTIQAKAPLVHAGDVMAGLWQALICTAGGLIVAVFAYAGHNLLVSRVETIIMDMEKTTMSILTFLSQRNRRQLTFIDKLEESEDA